MDYKFVIIITLKTTYEHVHNTTKSYMHYSCVDTPTPKVCVAMKNYYILILKVRDLNVLE